VASHGCSIRNFLCRASGNPIERLNETDWCDNTAISIIDFDEHLQPTIVLMNDASHLPDETSTFAGQKWWKPENRGTDLSE
jgi:probable phosphoglycerate mutase